MAAAGTLAGKGSRRSPARASKSARRIPARHALDTRSRREPARTPRLRRRECDAQACGRTSADQGDRNGMSGRVDQAAGSMRSAGSRGCRGRARYRAADPRPRRGERGGRRTQGGGAGRRAHMLARNPRRPAWRRGRGGGRLERGRASESSARVRANSMASEPPSHSTMSGVDGAAMEGKARGRYGCRALVITSSQSRARRLPRDPRRRRHPGPPSGI